MAFDAEKYKQQVYADDDSAENQDTAAESTPSVWDRFIEHPLETIGEVVTNRAQMQAKYAQDSAEVASEMAQGAVDTAHDIAAAYNDFGEKRKEFLQQGAELQQEYSPEALAQANEIGDYSAQSEAVQNAQTAGDEMVTATRNLILSPGRQAVRSFVNAYEDDTSDSLFAETAHSIASSDAGIEYLMTDAERMQKAKAIQDKTGIPVEAFLGDTKAYRQAMDIYDFAVKNDALPNDLWQQYPELQNLANMSPHDAAIALHHIDEVSTTHGIVDTFTHFLEIGNKNLEYNNLQYKIFMGTADDNDRQRAADLRSQLEQETKKVPSFFSDPGAAMAAGIAQSLPEMWQSTVQAIDDAAVMASVAMIAGAAAGSAVGGVGALPGAAAGALGGGLYGFGRSLIARQVMRPMAMATRAGLEASVRAGAFRGMLRPEVGQRYAEYKELKDKNGNPLLTDDEAKWYALAGGAANAGIELANFGAIKNTFARAPHASKVFSDIIRNSNARLEANEAFRLMARDKAADMFKITLSESGEEALQSVSDDVVHNRIVAGRNTDEKPYDASTIAGHAFQSFAESLPGSMGFGLASGIGGGITTSGRLGVQMRDRAKFVAKYGNDARKTINGTLMLEELQQAISSGKMREKAPETQQKILKEQLDQTEYKDTYIDTEVALQSPNGMEDLKKAAKAGGYTDEELQVAITEKGHLLIPTERLAQAGTSSELLDAASFTQDSESMGRMRMNAKATMEAVQKQEQEDIEKQVKLFDTIVDEYYPTDESGEKNKQQRDMLKAVIFTNARNPAQGWNKLYKETRENLDAMLEPALKALNEGMGHAGLGEITDEVGNKKTVYTSDNAPWYRNFYKAYKRRPTKAELEDMAVAMVTGDSSAPQVQGFIPTTKEEHEAAQAMKPEIENLRHTLAGLREIKKAATSLTGAEMQITEGLSKEAYHVYRDLTQKIIDVDGNIKGKNARAARMGALLVARHADRWAEVMSKNTGKKVTALDWYRSFEVSNSEKPKHENADGTPYATMNQEDSKKKIIAHSQTFKGNSGKEALKSALNWFKETYPHGIPVKTAIGKVNISRSGIKDSLGHGFSQKKLDVIPTLPQGLSNAVLVREIPDDNPNKRLLYQYMVYKVFIDDKENYVLCRIKDDGNVKKLYVHEVATAEEINKMSNSLHAGTGNQKTDYEYTRGIALYNSILSDYLKSVKENNNSFSQQTTAFAAWFGTSKILNEDGSPRVMYHGTATDGIRIFDTKKAQDKAGRQMGFGWGKGKFYFTGYENIAVIAGQGAQSRRQGKNPQAMPVYLRVEKPISAEEYATRYEEISGGRKLSPAHYDDSYTMKDRDKFITKLDKQLKKEGYDGIVDGPLTAPSAVAVFSNKQIKSVNNTGAWDINNPDIYYQERLGITSTYTDGFRIVSLLENANESTFMHEMAHIFLLDLQQLAAIDSVSAKSLQIVNEWAAWHKGAAEEYRKTPWAKEFADREQAIIDAEAAGDYDRADKLKNQWRQERFARAFELYLRDGQAPAKGLKAVFRAFAKFLRQVYRAFLSDGGTASEQVRRVMDRMIATEDEIEAAALDDRYNDVTAAGGEKLFNESEKETYQRWWQESLEEAKEKLRKVVFKDLEEVRQREFDQRVAIERARKEKELQGEPVYIAMRALEETNYSDLNIVLNWFGSLEEFQKAVNETPSLEDELNKWMQEYRENLDKELLQAEITDEVVDQAMMGASYRAKLEALTGKAFAKKQSLVRSINAKTRQAMRSVEEKLDAIPDDIDLQMDKESNVVKELWKTIYKLRSSKKWSTDDYRHLNSLLKSATKEEARKAYKEFKQKIHQKEEENREKARQQKQDQKREQR